MLRNELIEKHKRISQLETSLEESERTNSLFIENLNRDIQTLQDTLKNSEFLFKKIVFKGFL